MLRGSKTPLTNCLRSPGVHPTESGRWLPPTHGGACSAHSRPERSMVPVQQLPTTLSSGRLPQPAPPHVPQVATGTAGLLTVHLGCPKCF
jgi:hypothetical protein